MVQFFSLKSENGKYDVNDNILNKLVDKCIDLLGKISAFLRKISKFTSEISVLVISMVYSYYCVFSFNRISTCH